MRKTSVRFSPRNGGIILKNDFIKSTSIEQSLSPRNGEIILKMSRAEKLSAFLQNAGFSPRNGEIILKLKNIILYLKKYSFRFQSPQWGNNSKGKLALCQMWGLLRRCQVFVGKIIA